MANEIQKITFTNADPNVFRAFRATGGSDKTADFTLAAYISGGVLNTAALIAFLNAQIEGLAAYGAVNLSVDTPFTANAGNWSGALLATFVDPQNVPQLEAVTGLVQNALVSNGDGGNYSFNGGANFTLPITENAFRDNQRAATGVNTLVSKGTSSAGAPVFSAMAALPQSSSNFGWGAAVNGKFYVFASGSAGTAIREFDPVTNVWTTKNAVTPAAHVYRVAAAANGKIYLFGGGDYMGSSLTNAIVEYDPGTDTITTKSAVLPVASYGMAAVSRNGKILLFGGFVSDGTQSNVIREYDPATDTITTKSATLPVARGYMSATLGANDKVYLFGGYNSSASIYEYDPVANTSATKVDLGFARVLPGLLVSGNKIYVASGGNTATEIYDVVTNTVANASLPATHGDTYPASVQIGNTVYIANEYTGTRSEKLTIPTPALAMKTYFPPNATAPSGAVSGTGATVAQGSSGTVVVTTQQEGTSPPPVVTSVTPSEFSAGDWVVIIGENFTGAEKVEFSGRPSQNFVVVSDTEIRALVPRK